ncbi:hypothetical protein PUNSTDRAFT_43308 [Punctularia strigosozonata HHB-11173 SS5]|uniref:uncharacterized protein n=1 Tax=Punctularia strigosozonata (strain HHB-11173) TaxID=741275 RepID=UPI000441729E|nr:uncharacterized protein PUNSTDRAFT_43308 [Punctularia strigosozonata HHB-11173 SS5]EIN10371.1 hypothetical protein PUNSTDRAFT_43308 [Punctularia strigosozonata HHB-11173 SS5]
MAKSNPLQNMKAMIGRSAIGDRQSASKLPKVLDISEPQSTNYNALDIIVPRQGKLGTGATVVRTPEDALHEFISEDGRLVQPSSKALPSPPLASSPTAIPTSRSSPSLPLREIQEAKPAPIGPLPPVPGPSTATRLRPSMKPRGSSPPSSGEFCPPVPALPAHVTTSPPQPPFDAILLSDAPPGNADPKKTIVVLETSTATYKTTLATLTSSESHLSTYLTSLREDGEDEVVVGSHADDTASVYSTQSETNTDLFNSLFQRHLATTGVITNRKPRVSPVHIFLDRPSAPYAHILNYLRTPSTPDAPPMLPRAVQLFLSSSYPSRDRLESLLELRDEAKYLGLDALYTLCVEELGHRTSQGPRPTHARGMSSSSTHTFASGSSNTHVNPELSTPSIHSVLDAQKSRARQGQDVPSSPPVPPATLAGRRSRSDVTSMTRVRPAPGWI